MSMKKILSFLLAMLMIASVCSAFAETKIESEKLNVNYASLNNYGNTLYAREDRKSGYAVFDVHGNKLSEEYSYVGTNTYGYSVKVENGSVHCEGFVDFNGKVLVPTIYGDVKAYDSKWMMGILFTEATSDNYDYKTYGDTPKFYLIDQVHAYFNGEKVGELSRDQFDDYYTVHGDYLYMKDRAGNYHYYDKNFKESGYAGNGSTSEYDRVYANRTYTYYHRGSNQVAFAAGCTLTPDEVDTSIVDNNGQLLDLQGNVIAELQYNYIYDFKNGYARVKNKQNKYGLINDKGEEIIACLYDELEYDGPSLGYISAVKDGKQGFVCLADGSETGFIYAENAVKVYTPFAFITDLDGSIIVESAAIGVLPVHYQDYRASYTGASPIVTVKSNGACGVIGLYGEEIIPFNSNYTDTYNLDVSYDGTVVLTRDDMIYRIDYDLTPVAEEPAPVEDPVAPTADEGWTCPGCGQVNAYAAKFCPNDGTPQPEPEPEPEPVAEAGWTCPTCNAQNPETANFCPNDGTKRPPMEWTCPGCGNVNPAEANFCPNDGTKRP